MRFILTILFAFAFLTTMLKAQSSDWFVAPIPGEAVLGEFIARMPKATDPEKLAEEMSIFFGSEISVRSINKAGTDMHIRFEKPGNYFKECAKSKDWGECAACIFLEGNPGGGGPLGQADGVWPNYYIGSGAQNLDAPDPDSFEDQVNYTTFADRDYFPIVSCSNSTDSSGPTGEGIPYGETGDEHVTIAVLDSGVDPTAHHSIFGDEEDNLLSFQNLDWPEGWMGPELEQAANLDLSGHGTAVTAALVALPLKKGLRDQITVNYYRILDANGRGRLTDALRALDQAINSKVDVINMSFGFKGIDCDNDTEAIMGLYIIEAYKAGILTFASAGNDGNNLNVDAQWPAADSHPASILYTIGATRCGDPNPWEYSNRSTNLVDLTAPGAGIAVPFVHSEQPEGFIYVDGTSFATPIAAGLATVYLSNGNHQQTLCKLESGILPIFDEVLSISRLGSIYYLQPEDCEAAVQFSPLISGPSTQVEFIYPNPFQNTLSIKIDVSNQQDAHVTVYNDKGSLIQTTKSAQELSTINTTSFPPGIYFIRVVDALGSRTQKVIKH